MTTPRPHEEIQYLDLVQKILDNGFEEEGRNGPTKSLFGASMRFSLQGGRLPLLTTKRVAWKTCLKELLWFIRGSTSNEELVREGVHIWSANATREFLDGRGLTAYKEGQLGPIYGHQWRNFNGLYCGHGADQLIPGVDQLIPGVDQLTQVIDTLKDPATRSSRRIVMSAWNPCQLDQMALPPCHVLCQFRVQNGNQLSCALYQRSGDMGLGVPFNIASYAFLTHLLAKVTGLEAYEFVHFLGDCHVYPEHEAALREQMKRTPVHPFPTLRITTLREKIEDYKVVDFVVEGYQSEGTLAMAMKA
jgi:thymidylate synthase